MWEAEHEPLFLSTEITEVARKCKPNSGNQISSSCSRYCPKHLLYEIYGNWLLRTTILRDEVLLVSLHSRTLLSVLIWDAQVKNHPQQLNLEGLFRNCHLVARQARSSLLCWWDLQLAPVSVRLAEQGKGWGPVEGDLSHLSGHWAPQNALEVGPLMVGDRLRDQITPIRRSNSHGGWL